MKYTPQQREELLRLFDARTGSIHEFAIQHKVSLCALYKWQKKRGTLQNFNVSIRDVQHMRSRIKLLEEAIKVLFYTTPPSSRTRPYGFLGNKTPNMAEAEYFAEHPTNLG